MTSTPVTAPPSPPTYDGTTRPILIGDRVRTRDSPSDGWEDHGAFVVAVYSRTGGDQDAEIRYPDGSQGYANTDQIRPAIVVDETRTYDWLASRIRLRGGWYWCERRRDGRWESGFFELPNLDDWDHANPALFNGDPVEVERLGGKPGDMAPLIGGTA